MNRSSRALIAGTLVAATMVATEGCTDNNATLFIVDVLKVTPPQCTAQVDVTSTFLTNGILDVAFAYEYDALMLVANQYTPRGQKQNAKAETTRIVLDGAEINLMNAAGKPLTNLAGQPLADATGKPVQTSFTVLGSGYVDSNIGEAPGFGAFSAALIPEPVGFALSKSLAAGGFGSRETVYATVKVFGSSLGNQSVTSAPLTFPITVCIGCLLQFPTTALVPVTGTSQVVCAGNTEAVQAVPCHVGQDDPIDCRLCAGSYEICRTPPSLVPSPVSTP
jgi:hypothetical protein